MEYACLLCFINVPLYAVMLVVGLLLAALVNSQRTLTTFLRFVLPFTSLNPCSAYYYYSIAPF